MAATSIQGLATGLNTSSIVTALLANDQAQVTQLQTQQQTDTTEQTAFSAIEAKLVALQSAASALSQTTNGVFSAMNVASSNTNLVTAAASTGATPGQYAITVNNLAQAEAVASQGFASPTSAIMQGQLQIQTGSGTPTTITIGGTNDTLQGLADAINNSGAGVSASIVNDGSSGQPYHLLLTSNQTGLGNAITITNGLTTDGGGAVQPVFNDIVQPAADASVTLGSGSGALTVQSNTDTVDGLINGVTLSLAAADPGQTVNLTVAPDTSSVQTAISNFVDAYNAVISGIDSYTSYDPTTQTAGTLLSDPRSTDIENQVRDAVTRVMANVNPLLNSLASLGITTNSDGQLSINSTQLSAVLAGQVSGVSVGDVGRLFALSGSSTNPGVQFVTAGKQTQATGGQPIQVNLTQAATQASISANLGGTTVIGADNTLTLTVDGRTSGTLTLQAGSYSPADLAQALQTAIAADPTIGKSGVTVGVNNNTLAITSATYGHASQVAVGGDPLTLAALGFNGTSSATGQDVAGSFSVNGVTEAATGNGQTLTGNSGNANTDGLEVLVNLTPAQVQAETGPAATLTVTNGIASSLNTLLNGLTDPTTGYLTDINNQFQTSITDIQSQITAENAYIAQKQQMLQSQFVSLETTVNKLKNINAFLTTQASTISSLANNSQNTSGTTGSSSSGLSTAGTGLTL